MTTKHWTKYGVLNSISCMPMKALSLNLLHPSRCSLPSPVFSVWHATVLPSTTINIVVCLQKIHLQTDEKLIQLNGKYFLRFPCCVSVQFLTFRTHENFYSLWIFSHSTVIPLLWHLNLVYLDLWKKWNSFEIIIRTLICLSSSAPIDNYSGKYKSSKYLRENKLFFS